jgi:hypothetical protein
MKRLLPKRALRNSLVRVIFIMEIVVDAIVISMTIHAFAIYFLICRVKVIEGLLEIDDES